MTVVLGGWSKCEEKCGNVRFRSVSLNIFFLCASVNIKSPMKPRGIQLFEKGLAFGAETEERALW